MLELPVAAACRDKNPAVFRKQRQRHADLTTGMAAFRDWGSSPGARGSGKVPAPHLFRCGRGHGLHGRDTDRAKLRKGNARVKECLRHPFDSIVKPEPLKGGGRFGVPAPPDLSRASSGLWRPPRCGKKRNFRIEAKALYRPKNPGLARKLRSLPDRQESTRAVSGGRLLPDGQADRSLTGLTGRAW